MQASSSLSFPTLEAQDLSQVANTILELFHSSTASDPNRAKQLQQDLQSIQSSPQAWGLVAGLSQHEDANVRFFSAHTAQVKISRDWASLPAELQPSLLSLLLATLSTALDPLNPNTYQPGNQIVIRKLFGSIASLLLRLPFHHFPHPILTVLQTISSAAAAATRLPPSAPGSGFNTPGGPGVADVQSVKHKMRLWSMEWCAICVEEIGRAGISEQKQRALRNHLEGDVPAVMTAITEAMTPDGIYGSPQRQAERLKEAETACRCAEAWIDYGLGGDDVLALLPHLYGLLPLPAAAATINEILSESIFKFGKGTKPLTEPLIAWAVSPAGLSVFGEYDGESSEEATAITKLLCGLVEHSSEWIVKKIDQSDVQAFLNLILRLTAWNGTGGVDEDLSQLTLPIYPLIQEAIMDNFQSDHQTSSDWQIAKQFFSQLVDITRLKVRWPGTPGSLNREDRENFDTWRRDAGEVIVGAYYILRDEMLKHLTDLVISQLSSEAWQDIEATLHCIRYSSEAVPLGEDQSLPRIFGEVLQGLSQRPFSGKGEERLRLTVVSVIQAYEEWFKYHPDYLQSCLNYLVPSLSSSAAISRSAADALKALCDMCRKKLVQHIGAFAELHGKIASLGPEEQIKVIQGITSVIQALEPENAIEPIEGILWPIVDQFKSATQEKAADATLIQIMNALSASFKGLAPSEDDIFDLDDDEGSEAKAERVRIIREDPRLVKLRAELENCIAATTYLTDGEATDALSALIKQSTFADSLISLSPLRFLPVLCSATEQSPSSVWLSIASTLVLRVNNPPSPLTIKKDKTEQEQTQHAAEEQDRWNVIGDAAIRLAAITGNILAQDQAMKEHPDIVESWFKLSSALSTRYPGVLLRLPSSTIETYMTLGVMGLSAQERFSLKSATDFFIALFANTRYPSPLESTTEELLKHFGPQILRAILLSAGADGPRSVIPNLAELLASLVTRVPGPEMASWLELILNQEGFPDPRSTSDSKTRLKQVVLRSRTTKKMREALNEFALVARGLDNTTYGNATIS